MISGPVSYGDGKPPITGLMNTVKWLPLLNVAGSHSDWSVIINLVCMETGYFVLFVILHYVMEHSSTSGSITAKVFNLFHIVFGQVR